MKHTSPKLLLASLLLAVVVGGCGKVPPNPNILSYEQSAQENPIPVESAEPKEAQIKSSDFVGDWGVEEGVFNQLIVRDDGTFSAYVDEQLLAEGTWKYVIGSIIFDSAEFGKRIYSDVTKDGEKLMLKNSGGGEEVWMRIIL